MAVLTRSEILRLIHDGTIKIDPFDEGHVGPASIDLHLDNKFRVFRALPHVHAVTEDADYEDVTELIEVKDSFLLLPGQAVIGITVEKITLPDDICGWLEGRSRFARIGLMVHMTAGFMQPGISNKQVLEMINVGPIPLGIYPGTAVCQFIFEECRGHARYEGRFQNQVVP
ncbi:MAG TPA: dCTP deaminase [Chloroflexota bacterium]|nr:dCTP deaminase [Chloroflexota bacterium]